MTQIVLVGLGAGAAAALLFASVSSGALVSILLFYLAPLPILIAALGWSHWSGLIAAVVYAMPAVIKVVIEGIHGVSPTTVEAAQSSGSSTWGSPPILPRRCRAG